MRTVAVLQNFTTVPGVDECDTVSLSRECTHPEDNLDADAEGFFNWLQQKSWSNPEVTDAHGIHGAEIENHFFEEG